MAQAGYSRDAEEPAVTLDMFPLMLELNGRFVISKISFFKRQNVVLGSFAFNEKMLYARSRLLSRIKKNGERCTKKIRS
jgi:hypothetical protein